MGQDFLERILDVKRQEVDAARAVAPQELLHEQAMERDDHRPFWEALRKPGPHGVNVISEIKRASPSKGPIRPGLDPTVLARDYYDNGAAAISVLTDRQFFGGSLEDLKAARAAAPLPVLRKDFIVTPYQVVESAAMGADAVLLIVRALGESLLRELYSLCLDYHLTALVEVHSAEELWTATKAGVGLVGINNRDLTTFKTDLNTSIGMKEKLEIGQVAVVESGIRSRTDIELLQEAGFWNFLIGESLVRSDDPGAYLRHLQGRE